MWKHTHTHTHTHTHRLPPCAFHTNDYAMCHCPFKVFAAARLRSAFRSVTRRWHVFISCLCLVDCAFPPLNDPHLCPGWEADGSSQTEVNRGQLACCCKPGFTSLAQNIKFFTHMYTEGSALCSGGVVLATFSFKNNFSLSFWYEPQPSALSFQLPSYVTSEYLFFLPVVCLSWHHIAPLSGSPHLCGSLFLALSPCSNQCLWWIIHSEQWGLKLFDWQLYSPVSYIINIPLSGIVAMVKAIIGQRRVGSLMKWLPPPLIAHPSSLSPSIPPSLIPCILSYPLCFVCPPEGHCLALAHGVEQISFKWPLDRLLYWQTQELSVFAVPSLASLVT